MEEDLPNRGAPTDGGFTIRDIYLYVMARWYVDVYQRIGGEGLAPFAELEQVLAQSAGVESRASVAKALALDDIETIATRPA